MALTYFVGAGTSVAPLDGLSVTVENQILPIPEVGKRLLDILSLSWPPAACALTGESGLPNGLPLVNLPVYQTMAASYKVESGKAATGGGYEGPRVFPPPYALKL